MKNKTFPELIDHVLNPANDPDSPIIKKALSYYREDYLVLITLQKL